MKPSAPRGTSNVVVSPKPISPRVAPPSGPDPFERILAFGERNTAAIMAVVLGGSIFVHSGFAVASHVREMHVTPAEPSCRAGETIQLEAFARPAIGSTLRVTNSAKWSVGSDSVASHAGGGFFRCVAEGTTVVTATYLNRSVTFSLQVQPPIVMVDVEEKKEEPPPPPPPEPEPEPAPQPQAPAAPPEAKATPEPPPPAAAKAGNLLTAPDDKSDPDQKTPYDFVTDPDGNEYGSGTVAKGGTADYGKPGAAASGVPNGTGTGTAAKGPVAAPPPAPAVDLSRKPALAAGDGCGKSFFPADADDDVGMVQVMVTVKPSGEVATVSVMSENPKGQGFGKAARSCLISKKFVPGLDKSGNATMSTTTVNVRFTR